MEQARAKRVTKTEEFIELTISLEAAGLIKILVANIHSHASNTEASVLAENVRHALHNAGVVTRFRVDGHIVIKQN